ncbi:MAG: hypothetical protein ACFBSE_11230 [Prochloraceae cyanobacterium]
MVEDIVSIEFGLIEVRSRRGGSNTTRLTNLFILLYGRVRRSSRSRSGGEWRGARGRGRERNGGIKMGLTAAEIAKLAFNGAIQATGGALSQTASRR